MTPQVERRSSDPLSSPHPHGMDRLQDTDMQYLHRKATSQQQQQHKEALRLALGSILTPKRPHLTPNSRTSSGTASPAYPFTSGTHTPAGFTPTYGLGPNSTEHLHAHQHHPHGTSRLGRSNASTSPIDSPVESSPASTNPSPRPRLAISPATPVSDMELLPPSQTQDNIPSPMPSPTLPLRPALLPLQPSTDVTSKQVVACAIDGDPTKRTGTPRAKFLQTLQSKSAWDALIHGSFS